MIRTGPPGQATPVSFFGEGHEFWQESSAARQAHTSGPQPTPHMTAPSTPSASTAVFNGQKPRPVTPVAPITARPPLIATARNSTLGITEEAPRRPHPRPPIFYPGYGGFGFFGYPFGFGFGFDSFWGPGCDPFWFFGCDAYYNSGYDYYASQESNPVDLGIGEQPPDDNVTYSWQEPPANTPQERAAEKTLTVLFLTDGSVYAVTDYWVADGKLHYDTSYGGENSIDMSQLDLQRTVNANAARGVEFTLRPAPSAAPAPQPDTQPPAAQPPDKQPQAPPPASTRPQGPPPPAAAPSSATQSPASPQ